MAKYFYIIAFFIYSISAQSQGVYDIMGLSSYGYNTGGGGMFMTDSLGMNYQKKHEFEIVNPGTFSLSKISTLAFSGNKIYGITYYGAKNNESLLFEYDTTLRKITRYKYGADFGAGIQPLGDLIYKDSAIYGICTNGGLNGMGLIFKWDLQTDNVLPLYSLSGVGDERGPRHWILHSNGKFYGTVLFGGGSLYGSLFQFDPITNAFSILYTFSGLDQNGVRPARFTEYQSDLYFITSAGGVNGRGAFLKFSLATNTVTKIMDMSSDMSLSGDQQAGGFTEFGGKFYAPMTIGGVSNLGGIAEWDPALNTLIKRYSFSVSANGKQPIGKLQLSGNKLYGVAGGGASNLGVYFSWDPVTNIYTKLADHSAATGSYISGNGTISNGKYLTYAGIGGSGYYDGSTPQSSMLVNFDLTTGVTDRMLEFTIPGNIGFGGQYGYIKYAGKYFYLLRNGGPKSYGQIVSWDPLNNVFQSRYVFTDPNTGSMPSGKMVAYNGKLYGACYTQGVLSTTGTLFEWDTLSGNLSPIVKFTNNSGSYLGNGPRGDLLLLNNKVYGSTTSGGGSSQGVLFEWNPATQVYSTPVLFTGNSGAKLGSAPNPISVFNNKIYGTTLSGGLSNKGVIYVFDPELNTYTTLFSFSAALNAPCTKLEFSNNKLYGMADSGGTNGKGGIFVFDLSNNSFTTLYSFSVSSGYDPGERFVLGNGQIIGSARNGGLNTYGTIFNYNLNSGDFNVTHNFDQMMRLNLTYSSLTDRSALFKFYRPVANGTANSCLSLPAFTIDQSNNSSWVPVLDQDNNVVAEINANGNNLGQIIPHLYINTNAVRDDESGKLYLDRNINFSVQQQPSTSVSVRFYITSSEVNRIISALNRYGVPSPVTSVNDLAVFHNTDNCGSTVRYIANQLPTTIESHGDDDYVLVYSTPSFSSFYISSKSYLTLPVKTTLSISNRTAGYPELSWDIASYPDKLVMEIERSCDGQQYTKIGQLEHNGLSGNEQYIFPDNTLDCIGKNVFYRIRMTELSGKSYYSNVVTFQRSTPEKIAIFPTLVEGTLNIKQAGNGLYKLRKVQIVNTQGIVLQDKAVDASVYTFSVDTHALTNGVYFVRVYLENGEIVTKKIIKH